MCASRLRLLRGDEAGCHHRMPSNHGVPGASGAGLAMAAHDGAVGGSN